MGINPCKHFFMAAVFSLTVACHSPEEKKTRHASLLTTSGSYAYQDGQLFHSEGGKIELSLKIPVGLNEEVSPFSSPALELLEDVKKAEHPVAETSRHPSVSHLSPLEISCHLGGSNAPSRLIEDDVRATPHRALIVMNLEEMTGRGSVSYPQKFLFNCPTNAVKVGLMNLNPAYQYKLNASILNKEGKLKYEGSTHLFSPGSLTDVRLEMRALSSSCAKVSEVCPTIYNPQQCEGEALVNGEKVLLKEEGASHCNALSKLHTLACQKGLEIQNISCQEKELP